MLQYLKNNILIAREVIREKVNLIIKGSRDTVKNPEDRKILSGLKKNGFVVIENFYDRNLCNKIISDIDDQILSYKDQVWVDKYESDHRVMGSDRVSNQIKDFFDNEFLVRISKAYLRSKTLNGFTLAAKLTAKKDNLGSGGGWHRDSIQKQIKSIIYLNDVEKTGGPFEYYCNTHRSRSKISQFLKNIFKKSITRYSNKEVSQLSDKDLETFTGQAGTLILVDTSGIHRGKPIYAGNRYALTNYYYSGVIPKHVKKLLVK
jgi:hypothetical protein